MFHSGFKKGWILAKSEGTDDVFHIAFEHLLLTVEDLDRFVRIEMMFKWVKLDKNLVDGWYDVIAGGDEMWDSIQMKLVRVDRSWNNFEIFHTCAHKVLDLSGVVAMTHSLCKQKGHCAMRLILGILNKHFN